MTLWLTVTATPGMLKKNSTTKDYFFCCPRPTTVTIWEVGTYNSIRSHRTCLVHPLSLSWGSEAVLPSCRNPSESTGRQPVHQQSGRGPKRESGGISTAAENLRALTFELAWKQYKWWGRFSHVTPAAHKTTLKPAEYESTNFAHKVYDKKSRCHCRKRITVVITQYSQDVHAQPFRLNTAENVTSPTRSISYIFYLHHTKHPIRGSRPRTTTLCLFSNTGLVFSPQMLSTIRSISMKENRHMRVASPSGDVCIQTVTFPEE